MHGGADPVARTLVGEAALVRLFRVQDAEDDQAVTDYLIEEFERETTQEHASEIEEIEPFSFRCVLQLPNRDGDLVEKLIAELRALPVIPVASGDQIFSASA